MKMLRRDEESVVFLLAKQERVIVEEVFALYPMVPSAHRQVTTDAANEHAVEWQRLLDEALAEQRDGNKKQIQRWLNAPHRFTAAKSGFELRLEQADVEWLLQVLNDIRVGCWIALGSPESISRPRGLSAEHARTWTAMDVCGFVQMVLLELF